MCLRGCHLYINTWHFIYFYWILIRMYNMGTLTYYHRFYIRAGECVREENCETPDTYVYPALSVSAWFNAKFARFIYILINCEPKNFYLPASSLKRNSFPCVSMNFVHQRYSTTIQLVKRTTMPSILVIRSQQKGIAHHAQELNVLLFSSFIMTSKWTWWVGPLITSSQA